ncbi:Vps51/Vps67-domain-containing protein [Suillus subluteus]|nr:Vps51/Vps67-domain-containing protein [Suillus subluteus]
MSTTQSTPTSPTTQRVKSVPRVLSVTAATNVAPKLFNRNSVQLSSTLTWCRTNSLVQKHLQLSLALEILLRKHYGLGVGPPLPLPGRSDDPMDLDSAAFDAKSYYEQLITASSLSALLKRENDLLTEIRQLDGDRQSLVYNHHHELIAASDTIAAMKTRAEGLDADLDLLKAAFSEISRLGAKVSVEEQPADGSSHA